MKKKVSLLFVLFCFCVFLFSLTANASTSLTLENGTKVTLSQEPLGTFTANCQDDYLGMGSRTVYFLTKGTVLTFPDTWIWDVFCPGRDGAGSVRNAYYSLDACMADDGGENYNIYTIVESEETADSEGIFDAIYCLEQWHYDYDENGDWGLTYRDYLFYVVVAEDYLTTPVKSVNLTPALSNTSSGVKISWSEVSAATGYYVYRKTSSASSYSLIKTITGNSTLSYVDTAVKKKNGTTYYYKVVPYSGSDKGTSDATKIVRLTSVTLSSVKNTASKKITVKWKKNAKATGYQIQYSTSKTFASGNKTVKVSGAKKVSKVISKLTKKKTYYVRIRIYKTVNGKTYYSAWSSKKSVKISK